MEIDLKKLEKHKKYNIKIIILSIFLGILALLIITSFYSDFSLTGGIIKDTSSNISNNIKFEADLTIPNLELDGKFEKVEIKGSSSSFLYVGDEKFQLENSKNNYIILNNYNGKISFDSRNILELKGKVPSVSINGIPVEPKSKDTMKIYFDENFSYDFLKINNGIFIKDLSYISSGLINLNEGKNIFNIRDEKITIKNFQGNLIIENNKFKIDGYIEKLDIMGESGISVFS